MHHPRTVTQVLTIAATLALWATVTSGTALAADATMRIDPATQQVDEGGTFTATVVTTVAGELSGAQATVAFDPKVVQIVSVAPGTPWADATVKIAIDDAAVQAANASGTLKTAAIALVPPTSVAAGDQPFLVIEFKAVGCGTAQLDLPIGATDASLIDGAKDTYGSPITVATTTGASVGLCGQAAGTPAAASAAPADASPGASAGTATGGSADASATGGIPTLPIGGAAVIAAFVIGLVLVRRRSDD